MRGRSFVSRRRRWRRRRRRSSTQHPTHSRFSGRLNAFGVCQAAAPSTPSPFLVPYDTTRRRSPLSVIVVSHGEKAGAAVNGGDAGRDTMRDEKQRGRERDQKRGVRETRLDDDEAIIFGARRSARTIEGAATGRPRRLAVTANFVPSTLQNSRLSPSRSSGIPAANENSCRTRLAVGTRTRQVVLRDCFGPCMQIPNDSTDESFDVEEASENNREAEVKTRLNNNGPRRGGGGKEAGVTAVRNASQRLADEKEDETSADSPRRNHGTGNFQIKFPIARCRWKPKRAVDAPSTSSYPRGFAKERAPPPIDAEIRYLSSSGRYIASESASGHDERLTEREGGGGGGGTSTEVRRRRGELCRACGAPDKKR
ncbi:hypothetical protein ALC60_06835 [Trachymyrmex zeteki]|uniref:Uncharacterized protein n=1 Tax=Mycetomoellerius zeteki TaxID=64791 RepID=A0A151X1K2_9HYME|nr:hypothetical protein ALC60_06835 [Trachymyrmex zeteki]